VRFGGAARLSQILLAAALLLSIPACRLKRPIVGPERGGQPTIGVLLPLSGKLKAYGEGAKDVARLASGELDKKPDRRIRIVVRDTKGEAEGAAKAVEDLVSSEGAIALIGPLFRSEAKAAAEKAHDLGVPLIALTADRQVTSAGAYVFHAGVSPEDETDALVSYAMDELGLKSFAVLHPRIEYGERMLKLFRERVEHRGGTVRRVESYGAEDTTFTEPLQRLAGRAALAHREDYRQAIAECKNQRDTYRQARCEREARENAPPIIDFEGLFIPDSHQKIALIAPAVASEDIIVERDREALDRIEKTLGRKVQPITLLGTSVWNSPDLPRKAGRSVENAIFPDAFFESANDAPTRELVARFRRHFSRRPELQDALIYDAIRFVRTVLDAEHPETTGDLSDAMQRAAPFQGATGEISFRDGTNAHRTLRILTIKNQGIRPIPRSPGRAKPSAPAETGARTRPEQPGAKRS
jgi:ABC-type branched-subunit amino acid transport system substrate-binding protein